MNTWEIRTTDRQDREKLVHVIAPDEAHAVIEFRSEYCLDEWKIHWLRELRTATVIERA